MQTHQQQTPTMGSTVGRTHASSWSRNPTTCTWERLFITKSHAGEFSALGACFPQQDLPFAGAHVRWAVCTSSLGRAWSSPTIHRGMIGFGPANRRCTVSVRSLQHRDTIPSTRRYQPDRGLHPSVDSGSHLSETCNDFVVVPLRRETTRALQFRTCSIELISPPYIGSNRNKKGFLIRPVLTPSNGSKDHLVTI